MLFSRVEALNFPSWRVTMAGIIDKRDVDFREVYCNWNYLWLTPLSLWKDLLQKVNRANHQGFGRCFCLGSPTPEWRLHLTGRLDVDNILHAKRYIALTNWYFTILYSRGWRELWYYIKYFLIANIQGGLTRVLIFKSRKSSWLTV